MLPMRLTFRLVLRGLDATLAAAQFGQRQYERARLRLARLHRWMEYQNARSRK